MKILILYYSYYRNHTEKIAQVFKERTNCDLIHIKDIDHDELNIEGYDLIGFGSGIYTETISPKVFLLADKLDLKGKNVFVFSTSGIGMKFYNKSLIKQLQSKGAIIKGSFACLGSFESKDFTNIRLFDIFKKISEGRPNHKDFKKAEKFIDKIRKDMNL